MAAPLAVGVAVSEHVDFELQDVPKTMVFLRILYAIPFDSETAGHGFEQLFNSKCLVIQIFLLKTRSKH